LPSKGGKERRETFSRLHSRIFGEKDVALRRFFEIRVVLDGSGHILEQNNYYPFGKRWSEGDTPNSTNRYRYNGKEQTGPMERLLDYGARHYSPGLGRWMSVDPLAELDRSVSGYAYVSNNPIKYIDPFGLFQWDPSSDIDTNNFDDTDEFLDFLWKEAGYKPPQGTNTSTHANDNETNPDGSTKSGGRGGDTNGRGAEFTQWAKGEYLVTTNRSEAFDLWYAGIYGTEWEWMLSYFEQNGKGTFVVSTSWQERKVTALIWEVTNGMTGARIGGLWMFGLPIEALIWTAHSHPYTKGPTGSDYFAKNMLRSRGANALFWVFYVPDETWIPY
jgi:RHS repeat-associated protein